jgi:hypothetical protein
MADTTSTIPVDLTVTTTAEGALIEGRPTLFIPESELQRVDKIGDELRAEAEAARAAGKKECAECGGWFEPRRTGGKPQKFCSISCKDAHHAEKTANVGNVAQRRNAQSVNEASPSPAAPKSSGIPPSEEWRPLLARQFEVTIYFDDDQGEWVLTQHCGPDREQNIRIREEHVWRFLDELTDALGVPSIGKGGA